jgi:hypothetical protein
MKGLDELKKLQKGPVDEFGVLFAVLQSKGKGNSIL